MLWATIVITRVGPQNPGMAKFDTPSVAVQFCASLLCAVVFYLYEKEREETQENRRINILK
jgi:hypothetical protein